MQSCTNDQIPARRSDRRKGLSSLAVDNITVPAKGMLLCHFTGPLSQYFICKTKELLSRVSIQAMFRYFLLLNESIPESCHKPNPPTQAH